MALVVYELGSSILVECLQVLIGVGGLMVWCGQ